MASNSSNTDHGNYVPTPVSDGLRIAGGETLTRVYVLGGAGDAPQAPGSLLVSGEGGRLERISSIAEIPSGFVVGEDASLDVTVIVLPGTSATIPLTVDLVGREAHARLAGIFLSKGSDQVTFDIRMNHRAEGCQSQQLFNGIAAGAARCAFFGKIVVAPEAQRTQAFQENHNIVLSDRADINTKPTLEIYADDVKCSHGATVGKLDEDEQYYMRSRGIPEDEAKVLQMISFLAPVISPARDAESLMETVESAVRSLV